MAKGTGTLGNNKATIPGPDIIGMLLDESMPRQEIARAAGMSVGWVAKWRKIAIEDRVLQEAGRISNREANEVGTRLLLAKTCVKCDLLLGGDCFSLRPAGYHSYCRHCACKESRAITKSQEAIGNDYATRIQAASKSWAIYKYGNWSEDELEVLRDKSLTVLEKSYKLRRTYYAVQGTIQRRGWTSSPNRLPPQKDGVWIIQFPDGKEFEA